MHQMNIFDIKNCCVSTYQLFLNIITEFDNTFNSDFLTVDKNEQSKHINNKSDTNKIKYCNRINYEEYEIID